MTLEAESKWMQLMDSPNILKCKSAALTRHHLVGGFMRVGGVVDVHMLLSAEQSWAHACHMPRDQLVHCMAAVLDVNGGRATRLWVPSMAISVAR